MYEVNPNPNYPTMKYTKGFIGTIVANIQNYREIIQILERNWKTFEYRVQDNHQIGDKFDLNTNFRVIRGIVYHMLFVIEIYIHFTIILQF